MANSRLRRLRERRVREVGLEPLLAHRAAGDLFEELALGH